MIVSLKGTLVAVAPLQAILEVNGVGYEVNVPVTTAERLPPAGATVKLLTVAVYREDSQALYGFSTVEERDFFRLLIEHVSGVGPKVALMILSRLSVPVLRAAIADGDVGLLSKCHGIGRKTAERLVVELKDKIGAFGGAPASLPAVASGASGGRVPAAGEGPEFRIRDATKALLALGYRVAEADKAVRKAAAALGADASTEDLVKRSLAG